MMAGNMRPRVERHTAPTNEINGPNFGMATAMATVAMTSEILIIHIFYPD